MKSTWDDRSLELATNYYMDGLTYGQIKYELEKDGYYFTRNAVLGKLNRKGVADGRTSSSRSGGTAKSTAKPKPPIAKPMEVKKQKAQPKTEAQIQYIGPIDTTPAWGCCQYTRDDVQKHGWQMCGHPTETKGSGPLKTSLPWCPDHAAICYQAAQARAA